LHSVGHVGIVACSAEGAALCYRTICTEGGDLFDRLIHPAVSIHTQPFGEYVAALENDDWDRVAELMIGSAEILNAAGVNFLICPDNTIHRVLPRVEKRSTLPWIHIAEVVAEEAQRRGFRRVGILGTRWLVDSDVYPEKLAARQIFQMRPSDEERDECSRIIMDELVYGIFKPEGIAYFQRVIDAMRLAGCDAVVLGCTEIPLIISSGNSSLPILDSTRLLARAALRRAAQSTRERR